VSRVRDGPPVQYCTAIETPKLYSFSGVMSSSSSPTRRPVIHRLLIDHAGPSPDAAAFATAAVHVYDRAAQLLIPLIGELGVNALAARSVRLIQAEFPWLTAAQVTAPEVSPLPQVRSDLERQASAVALAAAVALLATFTDLLSAFVGAPLTTRLLSTAWRPGMADEAIESST
jgi:hypothetical protein